MKNTNIYYFTQKIKDSCMGKSFKDSILDKKKMSKIEKGQKTFVKNMILLHNEKLCFDNFLKIFILLR